MGPPLLLWAICASVSPILMLKNFFLMPSLNLPSQFKVIAPSLITTSPAENIFPIFPIGLLQVMKGCSKFSPEPSLVQAEQPQLSQPFLIEEVLQPLGSSLWPSSGPAPTAPCPACVGDSRAGCSTPGGVSRYTY